MDNSKEKNDKIIFLKKYITDITQIIKSKLSKIKNYSIESYNKTIEILEIFKSIFDIQFNASKISKYKTFSEIYESLRNFDYHDIHRNLRLVMDQIKSSDTIEENIKKQLELLYTSLNTIIEGLKNKVEELNNII